MQAWKIVIPTSNATPEPRAHDGHEWIYVLSGRMRFVLGDQDRYGQARSLVSRSNSNAGVSPIQRPWRPRPGRRGVPGLSLASHRNGSRPGGSAVIAGLPWRWRGDGVVDEDGGDGGGGGEGFGVEDSGAGRGAVEEQRQLFAELFGVGGAGLAGGFGEPRGKGLLVVACVLACRVVRVVDFDGRRDEGAQGRDVGMSKAARSRSRGVRSVRSNTSGRMSGSNRRRCSAISSSLPVKCW